MRPPPSRAGRRKEFVHKSIMKEQDLRKDHNYCGFLEGRIAAGFILLCGSGTHPSLVSFTRQTSNVADNHSEVLVTDCNPMTH